MRRAACVGSVQVHASGDGGATCTVFDLQLDIVPGWCRYYMLAGEALLLQVLVPLERASLQVC